MKTEISEYEQQAIDFLNKTNTTFESKFLRFGKMEWDKKGENRNVFKITLSNSKGSTSFEFGQSLNKSCEKQFVPLIETEDKKDIFYGFSHSGKAKSVMFRFTIGTDYPTLLKIEKGQLDYVTLINETELQNEFKKYRQDVADHNKLMHVTKYFNFKIEGVKDINEIHARIRKRITDTVKESREKTIETLSKQADTIIHPTEYDVVACLTKYNPGTFEDFCADFGYDTDSRQAEKTYRAVVKEWEAVERLFDDCLDELREIQ